MQKLALTVLVLLTSVCSGLWAQYSISLEDVSSTPGEVFSQAISATIPSSAQEFVELQLGYMPTVVRIIDVRAVDGGLMQGQVNFTDSLVGPDEAYVRIWCETTQSGSGTLVEIEYEGLRGPDTSTIVQPLELLVGGEAVVNPEFSNGELVVSQDPLTTILREALGFNYPNPFNHSTTFYLSIAEDETEVQLTLFNLVGRIVYSTVETFDAGDHEWRFVPEDLELDLAQGAYYLQMETPRGSFHTSCVYLR